MTSQEHQKTMLASALGQIQRAWQDAHDIPLALVASTPEVGMTIGGHTTAGIDPKTLRMAGQALLDLADQHDTSTHPENQETPL